MTTQMLNVGSESINRPCPSDRHKIGPKRLSLDHFLNYDRHPITTFKTSLRENMKYKYEEISKIVEEIFKEQNMSFSGKGKDELVPLLFELLNDAKTGSLKEKIERLLKLF